MLRSTYKLENGRHVAHRRRRRVVGRTCPQSLPLLASNGNHEKINSWVYFSFLYEYGAPLGGPWGRRISAMMTLSSSAFLKKRYRFQIGGI